MQTVPLPLDRIAPDPSQPRTAITPAELERLAASIATRGLLSPLRVRPSDAGGRHLLVTGHRRYAALIKLGVATADCVIADGPADESAVLAEQLTENLFREDLDPVDEADGYRRYLALTGGTAAQAAAALHVPPARISRALALLTLPAEVQDAVRAGRLAQDTAYQLTRLPAGDDRDHLLAQAVAGGLSRDAARGAKPTRPRPADTSLARVVCPLGGGRSLTVSGAAVSLESLIASLEAVLKAARKARTAGWDVSTLAKVFRDTAATGGAA